MLGKTLAIAAVAVTLGACGHSTGDRAVSGAGLGAATGVAAAALTDGSLLTGGLVGAGVGAAAGALTDSSDVNLGCPWWRSGC